MTAQACVAGALCAPAPAIGARGWRSVGMLLLALVLGACSSLPPNANRTGSTALQDTSGTALDALVRASMPLLTPRRSDSGFRLLGTVESAYGSRTALIDAAQRTLDLQYYSIHYDTSTEELLEKLRAAARRGVRVRVLLDDFNAGGANAKVLQLDDEPNVEFRMYNPLRGPRDSQIGRLAVSLFDFQRIQQRMHNKVLIADNVLAVAGGRNLGNEYFGQGEKSNFLDLDILVAGRLVRELSSSFDRYWADDLAYPVVTLQGNGKGTPNTAVAAHQPTTAANDPTQATPTDAATRSQDSSADPLEAGDMLKSANPYAIPGAETVAADMLRGELKLVWAPSALLVDRPSKISDEDPDNPEETVIDGLLRLMDRTQRDLVIVSPYFVPGARMMESFAALRARGVRVRVLTNSLASNDAPLAHAGYARYRKALLRLGVELYELQASGDTRRRVLGSAPASRASLHAKAMVVDDAWMVVGSMNLDLRSAIQNTEIGVVVRSAALSSALKRQLEQTIAECYRVGLDEGGRLQWTRQVPGPGAQPAPLHQEPDASLPLRLILQLVGPLAPEELL